MSTTAAPRRLYHGTTRADLRAVLPAARTGAAVTFPSDTDPRFAYATDDPRTAWHYAELAWHSTDGLPRVYAVEPVAGDVEPDPVYDRNGRPRGNFTGDVRTSRGFRVVAELPWPDEFGEPDDWR